MMGKSKKLDNILNECLERLLLSGESMDECLQSYPDYAEELRPLLDTVLSARQVSDIEPRAEFKSRARYEFQRALREKAEKKSRRLFNWQPAWSAVVASIVTFILVSGVTVGAAGNSMPDQPLYPVKLATEQFQLAITRSPLSKAELYAELADKRVAEIIYLADKDKPDVIETITRRLDTNLEKIAVLSLAPGAPEDGGSEIPAKPEAAQEQLPSEPRLMLAPAEPPKDEAPPSEAAPKRPTLSERAPLKAPPQQPNRRVEPSTEKPDKEAISIERLQLIKDRAKLRAVIARYAKNHPDKLREALKNAPPSVRQVLLRAIAISEARYKEANKALEEKQDSEQVPPKVAPERPQGELTPQKAIPEPTKVAPRRPLNRQDSQQTPSQPSRNRTESYQPQPDKTEAGVNNIEQVNDVERRKATIAPYNRKRSEESHETSDSTDPPANTASPNTIDQPNSSR